jgi:hypothetical protein
VLSQPAFANVEDFGGIAFANEHKCDVIVLDYSLPDGKGEGGGPTLRMTTKSAAPPFAVFEGWEMIAACTTPLRPFMSDPSSFGVTHVILCGNAF